MNRGFLIVAQNTAETDYLTCAIALVHSIKRVCNEKVCLLTSEEPDDRFGIFDDVVAFPHGDLDSDSDWKLVNDWQAYEASPYEYTIKLEADMYIPADISYWWDTLKHRDLVVSSTIRDFKQQVSGCRTYRKFIDDNKLPDCYNAITYFRKSPLAEKFFAIVRDVFEQWDQYRATLACNPTEIVTTDWAYAIAAHIVGKENTLLPQFTQMSMVHMKQYVNNTVTEDWTDTLVYEFHPNLRIQTVPQVYPVHYHKKNLAHKLLEALCQSK